MVGLRNRRVECSCRSCSCCSEYSTEDIRVNIYGNNQGKNSDKNIQELSVLKKKPYWGNHFWARGYFVNTVGIDEDIIKRYVKYQEDEERKEEQDSEDFR